MKIVREHINEVFTDDSDPIKDLGIGIDHKRNFKDRDELTDWVFEHLAHILKTRKIPEDIIYSDDKWIKAKYIERISDYCQKYLSEPSKDVVYWSYLHALLKKEGYKCIDEQ
jgi:hypothetical protein